ncbi:SDR family NAD(P)-dependent oxidoreductase [Streptomyces sp. NPDC048436]|uniref:SDR family NAD(P)-dependent oxidoreductase n=1 Tax=Streptomyces sp. NPDC048436 TaxID=3365550 RepID=UPI00371D94B6
MSQQAEAPVVVVTGAARGIGAAIATLLHTTGYRLVLTDMDLPRLEETRSLLSPAHAALRADVTDPGKMAACAEHALERFGRLDVWINNAGVIPSGLLTEQDSEDLARAWQTNLGGTVHGCRAALPHMLDRHHGQIINIASLCAVKPLAGLALYSATKAAVVALSEGLRREIRGSGVRITCVLPYMVATGASQGLRPRLVRPLHPEQVARAVARAIRRPRSRIYVPGPLGRILACASQLPESARDAVDDLIHMDELGLTPREMPGQRFSRPPTPQRSI